MELGPRDMLSRAIITEFREGRGLKGPYGDYVHLDLTHLGEAKINKRLPFVRELARNYVGVDPVAEPIPVRPVVHYMMGGVDTDGVGATEMPGLYAAGECASVTINGANRLGSNSLTECLVFGAWAGEHAVEYIRGVDEGDDRPLLEQAGQEEARIEKLRGKHGGERIVDLRNEMNASMERGCGVFREESETQQTAETIARLKGRYADLGLQDKSKVFNTEVVAALELGNMLDVAEAVARAAAHRKESRGAHTRTDFPGRDDQNFLHHLVARFAPEGPKLDQKPVTITRWQPEERKY
jgi:succinate dehydrogenase/fumarate reductase flavoprotein subunit